MHWSKTLLILMPFIVSGCAAETATEAPQQASNLASEAPAAPAYLSHVDDTDAAQVARTMMDRIGGAERWAALASMHISSIHTQVDLDDPYTSDVWRNVGQQQVRLIQEGADFRDEHIYLDGRGWTLRNGEISDMSPNTAAFMENWNRNLLYAVLKDMGQGAETLSMTLTDDRTLNVFRDGHLSMVFGIDESGRFETFGTPSADGESVSTSRVQMWGEADGYVYPAKTETDAGAVFEAQTWNPSTQLIEIRPPEGT